MYNFYGLLYYKTLHEYEHILDLLIDETHLFWPCGKKRMPCCIVPFKEELIVSFRALKRENRYHRKN